MPEPDNLVLSGRSPVVARSLRRFAAFSALCLGLILLGASLLGGRIAKDEALREARARAELIADTIAGPLVNQAVRAHEPQAIAELSRVMDHRMTHGSLSHVKLWAQDGSVIWSDEKEMVGQVYPLDEDVTSLFGTHDATAELSSLDKAENLLERDEGQLLEVYAGATDADGQPLVFEAYVTTDRMRADQRTVTVELLALTGAAVVLFQVLLLPLALSLARRVERGEQERTRMVGHALRASELERRRIAQDLHDGVIQDLAGIGYALPTVGSSLPADDAGERARSTLDRISGIVQRDVTALRTMLIDITPPDLGGPAGLRMAVQDLCDTARDSGVEVSLSAEVDELPLAAATLAYRVIREGLRNVVKHAPGSHARVVLRRVDDTVQVGVSDDGAGSPSGPAGPGNKGLQLLGDTLRDLGGRLEFTSGPGGGVLAAEFPVRPGES